MESLLKQRKALRNTVFAKTSESVIALRNTVFAKTSESVIGYHS